MFTLYQPKPDTDGSLTGLSDSHLCMCSNACNYGEYSDQLRTGADLQTINTGDCMANPNIESGKSNHTCVQANIDSTEHYCVFDNVGEQTVADVVGARTNLPSRTV
jgi:hypothetical protein